MQIRLPASDADLWAMAVIRAADWGAPEFWRERIAGYLDGGRSPRQALPMRACYLAVPDDDGNGGAPVVGFVAGHLTRRHDCAGELQWINVRPDWRRRGVASGLLRSLAVWFAQQSALRVCVDVDPDNRAARAFYLRHGATELNRYWMVWDDISRIA